MVPIGPDKSLLSGPCSYAGSGFVWTIVQAVFLECVGSHTRRLFAGPRLRPDLVHAIGGMLAEDCVLEGQEVRRVAAGPG